MPLPRPAVCAAVSLLGLASVGAGETGSGGRRSGFDFMSRELQAMQEDDTANPGMLWVLGGEALWNEPAGSSGRACAGCHGDADASMRGVAARYPAFDDLLARPIDLQGRVNACRTRHQGAPPLGYESEPLLSLTAFVAHQSRGMPITPPADPRLEPFRELGAALYRQRQGQLDLACGECHDERAGERLGGSVIPVAHPTGYPIYRLEWQGMGSLQRRLRNCIVGVRAEAPAYGAADYTALELFLMQRAQGLPIETPAVRP
jgi:sulfur-oxidizing protein SoxA